MAPFPTHSSGRDWQDFQAAMLAVELFSEAVIKLGVHGVECGILFSAGSEFTWGEDRFPIPSSFLIEKTHIMLIAENEDRPKKSNDGNKVYLSPRLSVCLLTKMELCSLSNRL